MMNEDYIYKCQAVTTQWPIKKEHEHIRNNFSNSEPILIIFSQFSSEMNQLGLLKICRMCVVRKERFRYVNALKALMRMAVKSFNALQCINTHGGHFEFKR